MTLKPTDMLQIQSAIDDYEKRFPRRPEPTAEEALAWRMGDRKTLKTLRRASKLRFAEREAFSRRYTSPEERPARRLHLGWFVVRMPRLRPELPEDAIPAVKGVVRLGWWGAIAVSTASIFVLGAFAGGFK